MKNTIITSISALIFLCIGLLIGKSNKKIEIKTIVKTNIIEKPFVEYINNTVTNTVEKLVEKDIPEEYITSLEFRRRFLNAKDLPPESIPSGFNEIGVIVIVDEEIKERISGETLRNSIELELRKIGVSINSESVFQLTYVVDGFFDDDKNMFSFSNIMRVRKPAYYISGKDVFLQNVIIFEGNIFGVVGKSKLRQTFFNDGLSQLMVDLCNKILQSRQK